MSLTMHQLDDFIDTTINRMSGESGVKTGRFYVELRSLQQRVTQNLVDQCIALCARRGLQAERDGDGLIVHVNLDTCALNPQQSAAYNVALNYTRRIHGNFI
ncbi:hypothetical protein QRO08_09700 [Paracidovorax citrulli]|uniref:Uncharacterized protein n=2 Tax=Paracidovorax citrulli TaxID=80869 RepID=A0ABY9AV61_PARCI|nr:hypothetical protein [Paracidovorax citrulli]ATG93104.1 hypothetical protein CQB05_02795 [Paracidovorax citrulli]MVT36787.1 hypothetical protein [Paracidovorax citrulli]PVY67145.1 hypothetical protein C8E08_4580 [Paracidovorax citrulli]REG68692.1 hypothetical protein C8E07_1811 [Paracidovorax citrulli]RLJ93247.1 hypothetical protein C8E06_1811 [Paracidovorax citrulli]